MATQTITLSHTNQDGGTVSCSVTEEADYNANLDAFVDTAETDKEIIYTIDFSELKFLWISSSQEVLLETNDGTTPSNNFTLKPGRPIIWFPNCGYDNPITVDVTSVFITNSSGATANIKIRQLTNAIPA